jgi:threonine-phosphate decarboxylase
LTRVTSVKRYVLKREKCFVIDPDEFIAAMAGCDMAFLCNPNNPTGRLLDRDSVLAVARAAERMSCLLVVDEAFIDFTPEHSVVRAVSENSHLAVLRSLTKFYALPGLRVGYGVFPKDIAAPVRDHKEPWTVNTLAQMAGMAAFGDRAYQERTMEVIAEGREYLEQGFRAHGIDYLSSSANFYLLRIPRAREAVTRLRMQGILVRDCSNFAGLDGSYVRVAVRSRDENGMLLKELAAVCAV